MRETRNDFDPFAVAALRDGEIISKLISAAWLLFVRHSGSIKCNVTGSRQYSRDLPQGGLEIPCTLMFEGDETFIEKVKNLMKFTDLSTKKVKFDCCNVGCINASSRRWQQHS